MRAGHLSAAKPVVFAAALYLGLHGGHAVRRTQLSAILWPDADDATRGERLRWLMRQLRRCGLPTPERAPEIELLAGQVLLDIEELEAATSMSQVLAQLPGEILSGYDPSISDTFSRWLERARDDLRSRAMRVLNHWLEEAQQFADWKAVEELARRMIALDEMHERASLALADALAMQGSKGRAVEVLARYRAETGLEASTWIRPIWEHASESIATKPSKRRNPMVGRGAVLARLLASVDSRRESSRCIGVAGLPGMGKSRTLDEFASVARLRGARLARVRCSRADALRHQSLVADVANSLLELRGAMGASPGSIETLHGYLAPNGSACNNVGSNTSRAAIHSALSDVIDALSEDGPVAVIIDDAHWAEPGSWAILGPLVGQPASATWILGLRSESFEASVQSFRRMVGLGHTWDHEGDLIWLAPLSEADVEALCAARAAPRAIPPDVGRVLVRWAAGIPSIAERLVDHWIKLGELVSLPESVTRLVSARLDRLTSAATRVIEAVAVLGDNAEPEAVEAVSMLSRAAMLDATRELESAGMMRTVDGLLWVDALWTEAVLARVPQCVLQLQHRYASEWLEYDSRGRPAMIASGSREWLQDSDLASALGP